MQFTASAEVADIDDAVKASVKAAIVAEVCQAHLAGSVCDVTVANVHLEIRAGSVIIDAYVDVSQSSISLEDAAARMNTAFASPSAASDKLGITITDAPPATVAPMSLSVATALATSASSAGADASTNAASSQSTTDDSSLTTVVVIALAASGGALLLVAALLWLYCRRRASKVQPSGADPLTEAARAFGSSREAVSAAVAEIERQMSVGAVVNRFSVDIRQLQFGRMKDAALGVESYLCVPKSHLHRGMADDLAALRQEIEDSGTADDKLCMEYVLDQEAGSNDRIWPNGHLKLDCDANGDVHTGRIVAPHGEKRRGMRLKDFWAHEKARTAELSMAEVAALRMYTTAMYASINNPLRDLKRREAKRPHPLPLTVMHIKEGVLKLRAVGAEGADANASIDLYRGMRNVDLPDEFLQKGGTELAPMSTTDNLSIALCYSASENGVVLRLRTHSSMERGADLRFLSCFPGEREYLFPPLTYLQPIGRDEKRTVTLGGATFTVVEVAPKQ